MLKSSIEKTGAVIISISELKYLLQNFIKEILL